MQALAGDPLVIRRKRNALRNQNIVDQSIADDFVQLIFHLPAKRFQARLGSAAELVGVGSRRLWSELGPGSRHRGRRNDRFDLVRDSFFTERKILMS